MQIKRGTKCGSAECPANTLGVCQGNRTRRRECEGVKSPEKGNWK